ncbi:MAG: nuclear transport factor 2 family protein [Nevskiaceae bacterium]|nr:MAG: nuclear transport factor 2 family protein [Nevskiaceae bacterium]
MDLQEIADRLALQQLVVDYAYAIDERAFDRLDAIFAPDAYIDYRDMGGIDGDYAKVKAWLPQALQHFPGFMHLTGNLSFAIDGDTATGKVACFNPMVVPKPEGGTETMFLGLWYLDRYRRTAQGWRIVERVEKKSYLHNMPDWMRKALKLPD